MGPSATSTSLVLEGFTAVALSADYMISTDTGQGGVLTGLICEALETLASASNVEDLTVAALFEEMTASEHYASWRLFSVLFFSVWGG